jgi:uncharacterized protein (DUF2336 family)
MATSFTEIVALAKDRTPAGRRRLATHFSQAFFANQAQFNSSERDLALDIIMAVLRDAALEVRRELAGVLARESSVPRQLIVALANDVIEVAQPVLAHSTVLGEPDLLEIIRSKGTPHRIAIAQRSQMSDKVSDTLAATREAPVALALLHNIAIHLPESTLRLLAQQVMDRAEIGDAIAQRAELTSEVAQQIYFLIGQELRQQIRSRFELSSSVLDKALQETVTRLAQRQSDSASRRSLAERLVASGTITAGFLIDLLKNRGLDLFRDVLRTMTKLKPEAVEALCQSEGSEPLALVCRALEFSKTETASLLMMVRDRIAGEAQFNPSMLASALATYSHLTVGDARTVLWQWQADPSYLFSLGTRRSQ